MEFWGVEVKSGEPLTVAPGDGMVLHLSQACLGELKKEKGNESVYLFVNVDGKKLVLGTLFTEKLPQQQFDLVFDKSFKLSHNWKSGSVYFYGYTASNPFEEDNATEFPTGEFDDSEEDIPLTVANNGKSESKAKQGKSVEAVKANAAKDKKSDSSVEAVRVNAGKQKVKIVEPNKEDEESSDEDLMSEDSDEDDSEDSDDSDDESDESDEETPKKVEQSKKRPADSAPKTPVQDKKAKVTPQKTDGKKAGAHVATPHPAKQAGKTPANKPNPQTPKSAGSHSCKSCNRSFGSEKALESHSKAKHTEGK